MQSCGTASKLIQRSLKGMAILWAILFSLGGIAEEPADGQARQQDYQLGLGYKISDALTIGGYFSTEYEKSDAEDTFVLDDLAFLAYGNISNFSYLVELESVNFYVADFENDTEEWNRTPAVERLYGDYSFSDYLSVRFGKQITPIGYWNLQPINVLRETTSNPEFSRRMFPKFLTGVDMYGYSPIGENLTYHFYLQFTEDLDDEYINIAIDRHVGMSLDKELANDWFLGGSVGEFVEIDDTKTDYVQLNAKKYAGRFQLQAEAVQNFHDLPDGSSDHSTAGYIQGEYHFSPKHALVSRYEYIRDQRINEKKHIGILGYSYRPRFPISLKAEYQWHSDSNDNQLLTSFSVLF
jgi:hypothetical protein